jgi:hypothetical protein
MHNVSALSHRSHLLHEQLHVPLPQPWPTPQHAPCRQQAGSVITV